MSGKKQGRANNKRKESMDIKKELSQPFATDEKGILITKTILKDDRLLYHSFGHKGLELQDVLNSCDEVKKAALERYLRKTPRKIILAHGRCPGDILVLTCLVRDIKKQYKNGIKLMVDTPECPAIWENNPYLSYFETQEADQTVGCDYGKYGTKKSNTWQYHFYHGFRLHFEEVTGIPVTPRYCFPEIYLTEKEKKKTKEIEDLGEYWLIWPGYKADCQLKKWPVTFWEEVLDHFAEKTFVQIGESCWGHTPIGRENVVNYIDKTKNYRDLFRLMYHAQGSIGYISLQCHLAAAFKKPCIILAGAREPVTFIKYNNQTVLSTQGWLPCGDKNACWGGQIKGKKLFLREVKDICANPIQETPLCMWLISPQMVIAALDGYLKGPMYASVKNYPLFRKKQEQFADTGKQEEAKKILDKEIFTPKKPDSLTTELTEEMTIEKIEYPVVKKEFRKIFRLVANAVSLGGGERTAIRIIELMDEAGYGTEFVPSYRGKMITQFGDALPERTKVLDWQDIPTPCDIFMFHCNDLVWDFSDTVQSHYRDFQKIQANRKVLSINFAIGEIGKAKWTKGFDLYICQSSELSRLTKKRLPDAKILILPPPNDLTRFFTYDYSNRDYSSLRLIRHSSQGMKKYPDTIIQIISTILKIRESRIILMPTPEIIPSLPRVQRYRRDAIEIEKFLSFGNVFWYYVDPIKWRCIGENVVLEALASGLPVLCNNNYGLNDLVTNEVGWIVEDIQEMYDQIRSISMEEIRRKGDRAREYAKEKFLPCKWTDAIIGEKTELILTTEKRKEEIFGEQEANREEDIVIYQSPSKEKDNFPEIICIDNTCKFDFSLRDFIFKKESRFFPECDDKCPVEYIIKTDKHQKINPKVSFVVATYKRYDYIHRTIQSVINQTHPFWELIVVSDGPDDIKKRIVGSYQCIYPSKIRYFETQQRGCWGNYIMYDAIDYCHGEFIFNLDDDDEINLEFVKEFPDSKYDFIWHRVKFMKQPRQRFWGNNPQRDMCERRIGRPSVLIKRDILRQARKRMNQYFRHKNFDYITWQYIIEKLNPKVKCVDDCYSIAHDTEHNSFNPEGQRGFNIDEAKFFYAEKILGVEGEPKIICLEAISENIDDAIRQTEIEKIIRKEQQCINPLKKE